MKMEVTLSEMEVKEIVAEYLEKKFSKVGEVKFKVTKEGRGYGYAEQDVAVFKGATCEVDV